MAHIEGLGKGLLAVASKLGKLEISNERISKSREEIKQLLSEYKSQARDEVDPRLKSKLKNYLKKLNANSRVPFNFRLEVMDMFTDCMEILDDDLVPEVLNSYKVAIEVLYRHALKDQELAPPLAELAAMAMTLATRTLRKTARQYRRTSLIGIRETLSLAKIGLELTGKFNLEGTEGAHILRQQIALHEIIRSMRTRAMTVIDQDTVIDTIQENMHEDHLIDVRFIPRDSHIEALGFALIADVQKPHLPPRKSLRLNETTHDDIILCELDLLVTKLIEEMKSAQSLMGKSASHYHDEYAFVSEKLNRSMVSGLAVIDMMREKKRIYERKPPSPAIYIQIEEDVGQVMSTLAENKQRSPFILQSANTGEAGIWLAVDVSEGGYCLEKMPSDAKTAPSRFVVSDLVYVIALTRAETGSKDWKELDRSLCTVCWYEMEANNVARIGLAKLKNGEIRHARITSSLLSTEAPKDFAAFVENISENKLGIWTVGMDMAQDVCIEIHTANGVQTGKIGKPMKCGANYTVYSCKLE